MTATTSYALTGDPYVDSLLGGVKWATLDLTYSFPTSASYYGGGYGDGEPTNNFGVLNATQEAAARATFDAFSSVANLTFTEVAETSTKHADIRLAMSDAPSTAWAYFPSTADEGGDIWFNNSSGYYDNPNKGNYAFVTFLHEMGHALGLEHAHEHNVMPMERDSMEYTVMSYRSYVGGSTSGGYTNETWGYAQSLMMYDIAALQHLYGANYETNSGNTTYSWSPTTGEMRVNGIGEGAPGGNRIFLTVWDGGGQDTYDFSTYSNDLEVDLRPGEWTTTSASQLVRLHYNGSEVAAGNIANALLHDDDPRSLIENAKGGSGNDEISGNAAANRLWGNAGNDRLYGGDGNDVLLGGTGADLLNGDKGFDYASYAGATTGVTARLDKPSLNTADAMGDSYANVEGLIGSSHADLLVGDGVGNRISGGVGDDRLHGLGGNDVLSGNGGNDRLYGASGTDRLYGGDGNDTLIGGYGADLLNGGAGTDIFRFQDESDSGPSAKDRIQDFVSGMDKIDLRAIDGDINVDGNQALCFIGENSFSGTAAELNFLNGMLGADTNGDGISDFELEVLNVAVLVEGDFFV